MSTSTHTSLSEWDDNYALKEEQRLALKALFLEKNYFFITKWFLQKTLLKPCMRAAMFNLYHPLHQWEPC